MSQKKKWMLYKSKKFLIIFFLILLVFFFGLIFEHYKLYPRNEIALIIKKNTLIKTLIKDGGVGQSM